MAKKYKSTKLLKQTVAAAQKPASVFGKFANRLSDSKKKKIQKLSDTQKRLLESKKNNKMIKISKKAKKFALLDEDDPSGQGAQGLGLTHRGINVRDLKQFDDVNFNESDLENDQDFDNFQEKVNFAGFEATDNLLEQKQNNQSNKPKTQSQIYKQIIEKSKAYKMVRQQQYEQNFNMANQLDEGFDQLVSQLKFRNKDQQMLEKLEHRDLEYDKLMNELRGDQRIVSNKIVEKSEKDTERIRKKKNEQLNKLMRDSDGEEGDIRGWVDDQADNDEENNEDSQNQQEENDEEEEEEGGQEGSYDQLDDVNLSSSQEQEEQGEEMNQNAQIQAHSQQQGPEEQESDEEQDELDQDEQQEDEDEDSSQEQESESPLPPPRNNKKQAQQNTRPTPQVTASRQNPQKKVKLNFIQ